ncbi:hypothetical protein [Nakamurella endophytica]|uniref:Uncharacterized protein n=1 Tax=Nakamurella endophytica TaxID=1748367 RepID=A0A917SWZ2_9ACTN|nr:hypothetical protein [Nakamurella endophytica]GGM00484.1 hypothetical protein GCM10011594_20710 [Nakamurella endophytica]
MTEDLVARFGSARRPDPPRHPRPDGTSDATVEAVGTISAALEVVENARGFLYAFHRLTGTADMTLQEGVRALREAGHPELADQVDEVLVGRSVVDGRWTYQLVEAYDDQYWSVFRAVADEVRARLMGGRPHVHESDMKVAEQREGTGAGVAAEDP